MSPVESPARVAAPNWVALEWEGPSGLHDCITPEALRAAVEEDLGRPVFRDGPQDVTLRVRVSRVSPDAGWFAVLNISNSDGQRELRKDDAAHCSALSEELILAATLMVDPDLLTPLPETNTPSEPTESARTDAPPPRLVIRNPPPPRAPPRPAEPPGFAADAQVLLSSSVLPGFAVGAEVGGELVPPGWPGFRARVAAFPLDAEPLAPRGSAEFSLLYGGVSVCPDFTRDSRFAVGACFGGDIGALRVESRGLESSRNATRLVLQGSVAVRVSYTVARPWFLGATAALLPSLQPDRFVVEREGTTDQLVFQRSPLAWTVGFGAGARYGR